jgi:murein DD-endopeptidase MepM/ murein hydrolase activator NlpD
VGDQIGLMGDTGKTTGTHLHFEVRLGKNDFFSTRNPDLWISPPVGSGVLVGQILTYAGFPLERQTIYLYAAEDNPAIGPVNDAAWIGYSYQHLTVNSDPYYFENFTLANLPAGNYYVYVEAVDIGRTYSVKMEIKPGQVTFFRFNLWAGFSYPPLPTPTYIFSPSP